MNEHVTIAGVYVTTPRSYNLNTIANRFRHTHSSWKFIDPGLPSLHATGISVCDRLYNIDSLYIEKSHHGVVGVFRKKQRRSPRGKYPYPPLLHQGASCCLIPAYTMGPLRSAATRQSINPSVRPAVTLLLTDACLTPAQSGHPGNSPVTSTNFHPAQIFEIAKFHVMWDGKPAAVRSLRLTGGVETYRVGV